MKGTYMNTPITNATGKSAARIKYIGEQMHTLNARFTPESFDFSVCSRDRWMIVAIVAILALCCSCTFVAIVALPFILR